MSPKKENIVKAFDSPVINASMHSIVCPICKRASYLMTEDFERGDSYMCAQESCGMWLVLPNAKLANEVIAKKARLAELNEKRKKETKKYRQKVFQAERQDGLFDSVPSQDGSFDSLIDIEGNH